MERERIRPADATTPSDAAIQDFEANLRGPLIGPGDEDYDAARQVFNLMIDRRPALIARCAGVADVINAVNFARDNNLLVAIRGAGHSVTGNAVCDGGLVIDLSGMKGLHIDPVARTARAEPGLTWGELNHDLQAFGLGATGGFVSITGISGLTLGGGMGPLIRKHGLALDNLLSADIVTADGQFRTVSDAAHPDLFWGVRGGGGNFGVVTSYEFRVHPVGTVLAGLVVYSLAKAKEVLRFFRAYAQASPPDELAWGVALCSLPAAPFLPKEMHALPVIAVVIVYAGPLETGEKVIQPLRAIDQPLADLVQPMPYSVAQTKTDQLWPPGYHHYWKSAFLKDVSDDAIDTLVAYFNSVPSPKTAIVLDHVGDSAFSRFKPEETAFPHRNWKYNLLITSVWSDPKEAEENIRWTRELYDALQPSLANAMYLNFIGDEGERGVRGSFGPNYERLVALKNTYDPTNLFRMNQNIKPTI